MLSALQSKDIFHYNISKKLSLTINQDKQRKKMTTVSQDVQTRFPVQLAFAKFLSKLKGNFWGSAVSMILALY